jgi:hypothetical protein
MSTLVGTVIDAKDKEPLPGVSVTASTPQWPGKTVVTDAVGNYSLADLQPGIYTLQFVMDAYRTYTRDDIELQMNRTLRVNVELLPDITDAAASS